MSLRSETGQFGTREVIMVTPPPQKFYISRVSSSSERMQGITFETSASLSLYGGNATLVKLSETKFSWYYDVSGSKHFHLLLLGGEISEKVTISRKFKERVVQPILKVKLNFDHKNWRSLFFWRWWMMFRRSNNPRKVEIVFRRWFLFPQFWW